MEGGELFNKIQEKKSFTEKGESQSFHFLSAKYLIITLKFRGSRNSEGYLSGS